MTPQGRRDFPSATTSTIASVLILLYPVNSQPWIVFMKRPEYAGAHSGQISLPGGKVDLKDKNLIHSALRETQEELGVANKNIHILGKLTPLKIQVSGFEVNPFVGILKEKPLWKPDSNEVKYLIETPVYEFLKPSTIKIESWNLHNKKIDVPFFNIKDEKIWGATAMIMSEFIEIIEGNNIIKVP
jgi:8-oxo-dGTP pyrophosphatase MutT (NUDIX family)